MENMDKIYMEYASLIKKYIFSITKDINLAEDIMQETFVVAINQIEKFRGDCEISVWLCSIAKRIVYKKLKENNLKSYDNKLKLFEALQKLDVPTREVIYLRLTGDLTFKEIGKILNKTESWAKVTFFRGKQKLRKEIMI